MNFTIELGWWLLPLVIAVLSFLVARYFYRDMTLGNTSTGLGGAFDAAIWLICYGGATIVSLVAWLIYAILN
jgi:uncharacterized membrane protein YhdT